ncbi:MAG: phoU [Rickettsiales bacterium]|nr:phoU [Rickettsiales bacterium]
MQYRVESYNQQLTRIPAAICEMGRLVEDLIKLANQAIRDPSVDFFCEAKKTDEQVNLLDREIEKLATSVLTFQKPMARDLRVVTSALKMCSYLESMGDLAKNVAKRAAQPDIRLSEKALEEFAEVADTIVEMVEEVLTAFERQDATKAENVWKQDDKVDALYHDLYSRLQQGMQEDPAHIPAYVNILLAAKGFERIGDYVTRLATNVYYITTGERFNKEAFDSEKIISA